MQVREIEAKDNQIIEQIIKRSLESVHLDIPGTAYFDPQLSHLSSYYQQNENAKYWVVVDREDVPVGGVGIAPYDEKKGICELQKLYLAPKAQGKGLAKELLQVALAFAEEYYEYCYLETMEKLQAANQLYARFGFKRLNKPLPGSEHGTMDAWYLKKLNDRKRLTEIE